MRSGPASLRRAARAWAAAKARGARALVGSLAGGLALAVLWAAPAEAIEYGGWTARATLDTWHDDNLARGVLTRAELPNGPQDFGLRLGLSVGNVFILAPGLDTWLVVSGYGTRGWNYPALSAAWGSVSATTEMHLGGGRQAYLLMGTTAYWNNGFYHMGEVGFVQPLWTGASVRAEAGAGAYLVDVAGASFGMPSVGLGFDQALTTGTQLGARYALQGQFYTTNRMDPRHQFYLFAIQRLGTNWDVHAHYLETINTSATYGYAEGYVDVGVGYDF